MMDKPSTHPSMECGRIRLSKKEISNMWCGHPHFGYICMQEGNKRKNILIGMNAVI